MCGLTDKEFNTRISKEVRRNRSALSSHKRYLAYHAEKPNPRVINCKSLNPCNEPDCPRCIVCQAVNILYMWKLESLPKDGPIYQVRVDRNVYPKYVDLCIEGFDTSAMWFYGGFGAYLYRDKVRNIHYPDFWFDFFCKDRDTALRVSKVGNSMGESTLITHSKENELIDAVVKSAANAGPIEERSFPLKKKCEMEPDRSVHTRVVSPNARNVRSGMMTRNIPDRWYEVVSTYGINWLVTNPETGLSK